MVAKILSINSKLNVIDELVNLDQNLAIKAVFKNIYVTIIEKYL